MNNVAIWGRGAGFCIGWTAMLAVASVGAEVRPLMREFVGINGHTVQFKPDLYLPVARVVRDYHPVEWDLGKETSVLPAFPEAKNRVNWSQVYGAWRERGYTIDVSLMFESVKEPVWKDIEADAKSYGNAFAKEFGPSGAGKLVDSVEIGNEPGQWSDTNYTRMFRAMATGIREGDPKLKIATCNLAAGKSGKYEKSVTCIAAFPELYDVLNVHSYAQLEGWPTWRRSFPEDPKLKKYLPDIEELCRWRDQNVQGKPIWLTEFGYDSTTREPDKTGDFAKWQGVTDEQQAQWLVRSLLVFSAMPVERAYIYFFNDSDKAGVHASSGLSRNFRPKPSFHAVAHLQQAIGDYRFERIVTNEPGRLRVQEYRHGKEAGKTLWVVWAPTAEGTASQETLTGTPGKVVAVQRMPMTAGKQEGVDMSAQLADGAITVEVSGSPTYLFFEAK